jgi:hypothetical protein
MVGECFVCIPCCGTKQVSVFIGSAIAYVISLRVCVLGVAWKSKLVLSMFASPFRNVVESLIVTKDEVGFFA